jgi:ABC-2 type transport system permease protein
MKGLRAYALMANWELSAVVRPMLVIGPLQVMFAASVAIGLGLLLPDISAESARYLTTGAPTIVLLTVGVAIVPQQIARRRENGVHDFLRTLPGARSAHLAATLTPHLIINLPGALLAVVVAAWYFDFALDPSPALLPALMFVSVTGAAIGNAIAMASPSPLITVTLAQIGVFFIMLFSPVNYPVDRLPEWLQAVHQVLPFESMATVVRNSLVGDPVPAADLAWIAGWAVVAFAVSAALSDRRT